MAQQISVTYACDYDDKEIPDGERRSLTFGLDGQEYEIDLCAKHSEKFRELVGTYAEHARPGTAPGGPKRGRRTAANRRRSADIRAWARKNGIEVSDRGRIPAHVLTGFDTSQRG